MFEFLRRHTKLLQLLLLVLILPSFVVFGIQGYSKFNDSGRLDVAKVDGQAVTQAEWDQAHQQQVERIRRESPGVDAKLFDTAAARADTLEALVRERVLLAATRAAHLTVPDERLQRLFVSDPQFATLRNADGSVNKELLAAQGMSSEIFVARLRQDLAVQQVTRGVTDSAVAPAAVVATALDALLQRREIRYARFDGKDYAAKVDPTEADLDQYYKAHAAEFRVPEQATIDFVVLDLEMLKKGITVPEDDLRKFYAENASRYTSAEERRARHILVKAAKDAAPDVRQKAKARAEALLADARKNPAGFAELATRNSEDPGSAAQGGDLDFFGRGAMVKPFEDAVFAMQPGEIGNVVESDFGYHIIRLEAIRGGAKKPFEEVRAAIEDEARKQLATKRWAEAAEQFTNLVYEQSDSLQPAIDKLKLDKRSATVQRVPAPGTVGALGSAKLLEAVFSGEAIRNKRNTDAVDVGPNQLAAARVVQYQAARVPPLAEVRDRVRDSVVRAQSAAQARRDGAALLAQLRAGSQAELARQATVSRIKTEGLPRSAIDAILRADAVKLPTTVGVDLDDQGYLVARIDKVLPRELAVDEVPLLHAQYSQVWAQAEAQAYYQALRSRFKVEQFAGVAASK